MTILANGQAFLPAGTPASPTLIATIPSGGGTFNFLFCNKNTSGTVATSLAIVPNGGTISSASWIEYLVPIQANQILERGGIPLEAGATVYASAASTGVSVSVLYMQGQ